MEIDKWQASEEILNETLSIEAARRLAATIDSEAAELHPGSPLPAHWHWLYFTPATNQKDLSTDGHAKKGSFLPPTSLPRRLFAGTRTTYHSPLMIGEPTRRAGIVTDVKEKKGKSGKLIFVTVNYQYFQNDKLCIEEEQNIAYRGLGARIDLPEVIEFDGLPGGSWERTLSPDPVLLFRFSALTFNGHRIHYDRPYAVEEESYPGLLVHAPLMTILLLELLRENSEKRVRTAEFKALYPVFDSMPLRLSALTSGDNEMTLKAERCDGMTALSGNVVLE